MGRFIIDRYHATTGNASYQEVAKLRGKLLSEAKATFYITQSSLPFAPCLGHERLLRLLVESYIDPPHLRFLEQDRGGLKLFAEAIEDISFGGTVRAVRPGTIMFAGEPFADITGPFGLTQAQEIKFQHAFELPMTTATIAMRMRMVAGNCWLSDFSLRRNGEAERAVDVASYAFIGGFNDTSNMEAAYRLDIPAIGTVAHYWQQAYIEFMHQPEVEPRTGRPKHFEQVAFERWLDANPQGTTLLLDTIDVQMGAVHAALAATSTEARRHAFKGFRVDSGDLAQLAKWCLKFFEANGLPGLMPVLTGDLDGEKVRQIVAEFPEVAGFGVGTRLAAEVEKIAKVIFTMCLIDGRPTLRLTSKAEKTTLPGRLQVFRGIDERGMYVGDIIGLENETVEVPRAKHIDRLLGSFWENGHSRAIPSIRKQKAFVEQQLARFPDIDDYPVNISERLCSVRDELAMRMRKDDSGWQNVLKVPESLVASIDNT
jgi:nicotinate phosphoribosyltransferase